MEETTSLLYAKNHSACDNFIYSFSPSCTGTRGKIKKNIYSLKLKFFCFYDVQFHGALQLKTTRFKYFIVYANKNISHIALNNSNGRN
jgi:hypothetical protein